MSKVMIGVTEHFRQNLGRGRDYLLSRGLTNNTIDEFGLGMALSVWNETNYLKRDEKENLRLGNLKPNKDKILYSTFSNRLIIPIKNEFGVVVGFTGRTMLDGVDDQFLSENQILDKNKNKEFTPPKYLNTGETEIFIKGNVLFNLDRVISSRYVFMVEAQLSAIGVYQEVNRNVVSIGGTALTDRQIELLSERGIKYICLALDPDNAGFKSMYDNTIRLISKGFVVKVALLPKGKDPMDLIKSGESERLNRILSNPIDGIEYLIRYFNHKNESLSKFKYFLKCDEFFSEFNPTAINIKIKEEFQEVNGHKSLGWFLERERKRHE